MMIDKNVHKVQDVENVKSGYQQNESEALTNHFRQHSFDKFGIKGQLPDEETAVAVGEDILDSIFLKEKSEQSTYGIKESSIIDLEIANLSIQIADEMKKSNPNWESIDAMIRILAVYLQRKSGREEQKIAQQELDQVKAELKNVLSTYNDKWTLCMNIGCGAISIIGGCVGLGAGITGIAQLANGALKTSALVTTAQGIATSAGSISQGVHQAAGKYLESRVESKRTYFNYLMQRAKDNKDTAQQGASTARQGTESAKTALDRINEARHQAMRAVASAA